MQTLAWEKVNQKAQLHTLCVCKDPLMQDMAPTAICELLNISADCWEHRACNLV